MNRCILLVRVSSDKQSFDEQERELYQMALSDGFTDNNISSIAMVESATIKSEEERKGLNLMKEEIQKGNVTCVYAWEVSRISRRKDVLFSILRYLVERKINLKIKEPAVSYLNEDGTISESAEIIFSLFATMAESEMRNKKARFKRTKKVNAREGKYSGGAILYGYSVDENGYYIINDEEASIIRLVYDLYTSNNNGTKLLRNELVSRGINITVEKINEILSNEAYVGKYYTTRVRDNGFGDTGGYQRIYPRIVSVETFNKAKEKRKSKCAIKTDACFLAKGLIRCPHCGWLYCGIRGTTSRLYKCGRYNLADKHGRNCDNHLTVQMEVTDSILWYASSFLYSLFLMDIRANDTEKIDKQISILNQKISASKKFIEETSAKLEKIADLWLEGIYSDAKKEASINKIRKERDEQEYNIERYENELHSLNKLIEKVRNRDEYTLFANSNLNVSSIDDRKKMLQIVNQFIEAVEVGETEYEGRSAKTYKLHIKDGSIQYFLTVGRTKFTRFFEYTCNEWLEITNKVMLLNPI